MFSFLRDIVEAEKAIAPVYKAASVAAAGVAGTAVGMPWLGAIPAALPAGVDLALGLAPETAGASLFLLALPGGT